MSYFSNHTSVCKKSILIGTFGLVLVLQIFLIPYIFVSPVQAQVPSEFGTNIQVNDGSSPYSHQVEPTMAILNNSQILVGWKEADTHNGPGRRVGFSRSIDGGLTFTPNILMNRISEKNFQSDPWLISDSEDNAYFVWIEFNDTLQNNPPEGIGVARTTDGGENWNSTVNAADTPFFDDKETACIDSYGTVYIVWDHLDVAGTSNPNGWNVRFTKSFNGTENFTPTQALDVHALFPYIHCSPNDTLYISMVNVSDWYTFESLQTIEMIRSVNGGNVWSEPVIIPTGGPAVDMIQVLDTDSQENLYLAYSGGFNDSMDIFIIKSSDGGRTWNSPVKVNDAVSSLKLSSYG